MIYVFLVTIPISLICTGILLALFFLVNFKKGNINEYI
jgi:hypothetical protein